MPWHLTLEYDTYEEARDGFEWEIPEGYNAAEDFLRKHDDPKGSVALFQAYPDGRRETYTFHDLDVLSNRVASALANAGVERGDRVAVVVPQKPANPLTHLACWKLGAISVPLSVLFGPDALGYRLEHSGATAVVVDASVRDTLEAVRDDCPDLDTVVEVDGDAEGDAVAFEAFAESGSRAFETADTDGDTPAIIVYTSGSTGPPKGALHTHDVWLGHCPAFYAYFERDVLGKTVAWTPADWAWIGALGDLVFPAWHYGRPVVGYPMRGFDAETAFEIAEEFGVTDAFLPPTAVRMMMDVDEPTDAYDLDLDVICSGGEPLTPEIMEWAADALEGVAVNEIYGQTEANLLVCTCRDWFDAKPGSMGKPVPGHHVAVVDDETGEVKPRGEVGMLATRHGDDPVIFEEYWREPGKTAATRVGVTASDGRPSGPPDERAESAATREQASGGPDERRASGEWHLTGDLAAQDDDGYVRFKARDDDVIITASYRVGPGEVESAILEHPDVEQVGVIGVPDDIRGEVIKAFVQPVSGVEGSDGLREEIQQLVRADLAKHEYPRQLEFVETLPQTTTGKIRRRTLRERETGGDGA